MASVLTPYRSSDGNNPYTEAQLKALWKDLEPEAREPGKYSPAEKLLLMRTFLTFIKEGHTPSRAVTKMQGMALKEPDKWPYAEYATFMAWRAYDKDFADAYEVAYAMGTDNLEDVGVDIAKSGNASMLQFLLKVRNPARYNPKTEHVGSGPNGEIQHVHTVRLVAAKPREIEHQAHESRPTFDSTVEDAEIVGPDGGVR